MTHEAPPIYYAMKKLTEHRGRKRVWFDTARLADAGFEIGSRFDVRADRRSRTIEIELSRGGAHLVSRKMKHGRLIPVIDLNSMSLSEALKGVGRVQAIMRQGKIAITVHPNDLAAVERFDRLVGKIERGEALDMGSACHGGGIMDHALHTGLAEAGIAARLSFAIEIDSNALEASLKNSGLWDERSLAIHAPLQEVETYLLPRVDIMVAGLVCKGASKAGKAKTGIDHQEEHPLAGALFIPWLAAIKQVQPAIALLENVPDWKNSASQAAIRQTLGTWGYDVHETVVDGHELGALERRRRFVMAAVPRGFPFEWAKIIPVRQRPGSLGEVLEVLPDDHPLWRDYSHLEAKAERDLQKGNNFKAKILTPAATEVPTLRAGYNRAGSCDPRLEMNGKQRLVTVGEHSRIKGAERDFVGGVDRSVAHSILGNSVTYPAFVAIGSLLGHAMQEVVAERAAPNATPRLPSDCSVGTMGARAADLFSEVAGDIDDPPEIEADGPDQFALPFGP